MKNRRTKIAIATLVALLIIMLTIVPTTLAQRGSYYGGRGLSSPFPPPPPPTFMGAWQDSNGILMCHWTDGYSCAVQGRNIYGGVICNR